MTQTIQLNRPPRLLRLLLKTQNPFMKWLLRSPFHFIISKIYLLITFSGRKSGKIYTTPVQYAQQGNTLYIITSEGYTWWKNLRDGTEVQLHLRGKTCHGHAEISTDPQIISTLLQKIYPGLTSEQHTRFIVSKVAITITLRQESEAT